MTNEIPTPQIRRAAPGDAAVQPELDGGPSGLRQRSNRDGLSMRDTESNILHRGSGEVAAPGKTSPAFVPLFYAHWMRAVFVHFEVEPAVLQNEVPFPLDLWQGRAFVSLVAFTMERLRPWIGG